MPNKYLLMRGIRLLREAAGEDAVTRLIQGNLSERKLMWLRLMKSGDKATHDALADILIGLGIGPNEMGSDEQGETSEVG